MEGEAMVRGGAFLGILTIIPLFAVKPTVISVLIFLYGTGYSALIRPSPGKGMMA